LRPAKGSWPGWRLENTIQAIDLRGLDRHRDTTLTGLIPALSCRSCRPHAPFAETPAAVAEEHRGRDARGQWAPGARRMRQTAKIPAASARVSGCRTGRQGNAPAGTNGAPRSRHQWSGEQHGIRFAWRSFQTATKQSASSMTCASIARLRFLLGRWALILYLAQVEAHGRMVAERSSKSSRQAAAMPPSSQLWPYPDFHTRSGIPVLRMLSAARQGSKVSRLTTRRGVERWTTATVCST
jgi:hypothetical protein